MITFDKTLINKKFRFLLNSKYDRPLTIMKGGSSSAKTYSISQVVPAWILSGHNILIARESGNTLRRSIFTEIVKSIERQGLQKYFTIRYTQLYIQSRVSAGCAMFVATSDEEKLKSITPMSKALAFDTCIMEESSEISFNAQQQLRLRMRGKTEFAMKRTFMLLNPISRNHIIYKKYYEPLDNPDNTGYIDDNIHLHHSTYKDNPFLDQSEIDVLESMAEISPRHYEVYAKGMWGTMTKTVYSNWRAEDIDFDDIAHLKINVGLDWGHVHPLAVNFTAYDELNRTVYLFDELHMVEETLDTLADKLHEKIEEYNLHGVKIHCDWQEPRSITYLREQGFNAVKCWKPQGSVQSGIKFSQMCTIVADKHKARYSVAELSNYSWKERNGEPIDEVIKEHDDHCDAWRYSLSDEIKGNSVVRWGKKSKLFS